MTNLARSSLQVIADINTATASLLCKENLRADQGQVDNRQMDINGSRAKHVKVLVSNFIIPLSTMSSRTRCPVGHHTRQQSAGICNRVVIMNKHTYDAFSVACVADMAVIYRLSTYRSTLGGYNNTPAV